MSVARERDIDGVAIRESCIRLSHDLHMPNGSCAFSRCTSILI